MKKKKEQSSTTLHTSNELNKILILSVFVIIFTILLVVLIVTFNKQAILTKIASNSVNLENSNNYYYEVSASPTNDKTIVKKYKLWIKDNKASFESYGELDLYKYYCTLDNHTSYVVNNNRHIYTLTDYVPSIGRFNNLPAIFNVIKDNSNNNFELFKISLFNVKYIAEENYNNIECYKIIYNTDSTIDTTYFDKETLVPLKTISHIKDTNENQEYTYIIKLDTVKDEDVEFTNPDSYEYVESINE